MKGGCSKNNGNEGIHRRNKYKDLGSAGDMMVHESSSCRLVHCRVCCSVYPPQQESFKDVESNREVYHEHDAHYHSTEWCKDRDRCERHSVEVLIVAPGHGIVVIHVGNCRRRWNGKLFLGISVRLSGRSKLSVVQEELM